jgi:Ca2+-binding EF-hand superfamily protein
VRFREFLKRMDFVLKTLMEEEENHVIQPHVHELPETNPGLSVRFARMKEMEESKKLASLDPPSPFREESKRSSSSNTARSRTKPQTPSYLPESELSPLEQVMHDIRMKMYLKRMNINPVLRDFDTRGEFHITTAQFLRVLSMFDLMPSSEEEQRFLIEKYAPGDLKRAKGEFIHYRKFLEDMENVQSTDTIATYVSLSHQTIKTREVIPFPSEEKEPPKDLFVGVASRSSEHVWSVLLRDFDNNRSMLANAFRDQDSFNEGSISQAKFGRAITTCNFRLGYKELNDLCERYKDSSIRDSLGKPYVFWNDFFQELEDRHQLLVERLESDHSSPCPGAPELEMTEEEIEIANECLSWLVDKARRNRRDIFLAFLDLDEHRKGIISISLLERALSMLDLLPLPEQIQALAKRFGERKIDDQIDVNYRALIKAMEMIESGETTPSEAVGPDGYRQLIRAGKKNWKHGTTMRKTGLVDAICYEDEEQGEKLREELHQTMREISRQLCARQTDIRPFFRRMDAKRKTGELSSFRFRSAFTNAGLVLSEREFRLIEEMFNGDRDAHFVHYKKFLASLDDYIRETTDMPRGDEDEDEVDFGEEGEGGEEEGKTISSTHQETKGLGMRVRKDINGKIILQWSENGTVDFYGNEGLERLILKIDAHFIRNRIHITPFFHDYDRCHNNKVSLQQFISVLVSVGIPISPQEQDLLVLAFGAAGGHHEGVLIAYEHFTSVVRSTNKREKIRELRSGKHTPQTPMISNLSL